MIMARVKRWFALTPLDTFAAADIAAIVPCRPDALLIPKVQSADDVKVAADKITAAMLPRARAD